MATWPTTLPEEFDRGAGDFSFEPIDNVISDEPDSGEVMTSLRFTGEMFRVTGSVLMTTEQLAIFREWWKTDLKFRSRPFTWKDPTTGDEASFVAMRPYRLSALGGGNFHVALNLVQLP